MNNLNYLLTKLLQWIVNHPRSTASYLSLFISIVISSLIIFTSTPRDISKSPLKAELAQIQTELQVPLQTAQITTTDTLALSNTPQPAAPAPTITISSNNDAVVSTATNNAVSTDNINATSTTIASNVKIITVKNKDSLTRIFQRLKLNSKDAKAILALSSAKALQSLKSGQKLNFSLTPEQKLQQITYQIDPLNTLIVSANNNKFNAKVDHINPEIRLSFITGTINGSIYKTAKNIGLSGKMLAQITNIFRDKINLAKLRNGDKITILRKDSYVKGQKINDGELAVAELISKGKNYSAIAYTDPTGHTDFYTPEGYTLKTAFVRYPCAFKHISSPFSYNRYQPILHIYRAHTGVDLSGKPGTPVKATSNGVISFAGVESGYGNIVVVGHNQYSTAYAHLKGFAKQIHRGSFVQQGQVIGYLGDTGLSTGPHVHYEFRINGTPVNPVTVKLPVGEMIAKPYRSKFLNQAKTLLAQLNTQKHMYAANENAKQATNDKS